MQLIEHNAVKTNPKDCFYSFDCYNVTYYMIRIVKAYASHNPVIEQFYLVLNLKVTISSVRIN